MKLHETKIIHLELEHFSPHLVDFFNTLSDVNKSLLPETMFWVLMTVQITDIQYTPADPQCGLDVPCLDDYVINWPAMNKTSCEADISEAGINYINAEISKHLCEVA